MAIALVLVVVTLVLRILGAAGVTLLDNWVVCLRAGLAAMFITTASAHWGKRRADLIRMVPVGFPRPDLMVSFTGLLELVGAIGLLRPATAPAAAACLAFLLIAMFPANIRAAREHLTIAGTAATALPLRTIMQILFIGALLVAGFPDAVGLRSA